MSNTKHTPGPWQHVGLDGGWDGVMPECCGLAICKLVENNPANATLIAAAPELLEALKEALEASNCDGDLCAYDWHEKARAAIAKATGETAA